MCRMSQSCGMQWHGCSTASCWEIMSRLFLKSTISGEQESFIDKMTTVFSLMFVPSSCFFNINDILSCQYTAYFILTLLLYRCAIRPDRPKLCLHQHPAKSLDDESVHDDLVMPSLMLAAMETLSPLDASCEFQLRPDQLFSPTLTRRWLTAHLRLIEPSLRRLRVPKAPYSVGYLLVMTCRQAWFNLQHW